MPGEYAAARFMPPMLAQSDFASGSRGPGPLRSPKGEWLFEPKWDGLRGIAVRNGATVTLCSRNQLSFNARFPQVLDALRRLPADNFVLDGEVVGVVDGHPDFGGLQEGRASVEYRVFDMPWLLGRDLRHLRIEERKALLARAVTESEELKLVHGLEGDPGALLDEMCRQGWEGLVAKRAGSPYREGRSGDWQKLKCSCRQEFVIGGFSRPQGSRTGFGALLVGYWRPGALMYAGKVGTGFSEAGLRQLLDELLRWERPTSPFAAPVAERGARWVEPVLVAEVAFSSWTRDGRLRQPSFIAMRRDKPSREVVREECGPRALARDRGTREAAKAGPLP